MKYFVKPIDTLSAQCLKIMIFPSLRFYVKSTLRMWMLHGNAKSAVLTHLETLNIDFLHILKAKIHQTNKFRAKKL